MTGYPDTHFTLQYKIFQPLPKKILLFGSPLFDYIDASFSSGFGFFL